MQHEHWTQSGVRLRLRHDRAGDMNWLFLPGGPGIGSESLHELVDTVDVPGRAWLVDLPGDGSNVGAPGAPADPYSVWPQVLLEAAQAVDHPVYVGHSTGGEYLHFDRDYQLAWWPTTLPTLIVSGSADRIVTQSLWQANRFQTDNVIW